MTTRTKSQRPRSLRSQSHPSLTRLLVAKPLPRSLGLPSPHPKPRMKVRTRLRTNLSPRRRAGPQRPKLLQRSLRRLQLRKKTPRLRKLGRRRKTSLLPRRRPRLPRPRPQLNLLPRSLRRLQPRKNPPRPRKLRRRRKRSQHQSLGAEASVRPWPLLLSRSQLRGVALGPVSSKA